jgi:hypothetical protein
MVILKKNPVVFNITNIPFHLLELLQFSLVFMVRPLTFIVFAPVILVRHFYAINLGFICIIMF